MIKMDRKTATEELFTLNVETTDMDKTDYMVYLGNKGVPLDIITCLDSLWNTTKKIGSTTIHLGKIILMKLVEFIQAHPHAAIGLVLGAAVGSLVSLVPFIGPLLAPLTAAIGAIYGFCVGSKIDYSKCKDTTTPFEGLIMLANDFFKTLAEIFSILKEQLFGRA